MKIIRDNKIYVGLFLFFTFIFFLSPISGDDWGNYLEGAQGFHHMIGQAIGMYFTWEGRLVSRIFINILTYNKWLWNIVNSIVIVGIIYYINKICKFKNKSTMLVLVISTILFMNVFTFSQVVTWLAGNITYLFVMPLLLMYFYILYYHKDSSKFINILLVILNIIIPMFIEHMAVLLILLNMFFIGIDYYKNKKINKKLISFLLISIISFGVMYFSPGNKIRSGMENLEFNKLSLFGKIIYNIPNLIIYTYHVNYYLVLLLVIGNYFLIKNNINNKYYRIGLYFLELIPFFFAIIYLLDSFNIKNIYINEKNIFIIIYFFILTIINFCLLIKNYKKEEDLLPIIFYSMGILSNCVMLMSPTWGYRTSFATYLFLGVCYLIIIDRYYKKNKIIEYSIKIVTIMGMIFYLIFYISIFRTHLANEKIIKEANKKHLPEVELIAYPGFAPCNINPTDEFHIKKFKEYYKIGEDVNLKIVRKNWKYIIFYYN